ncbi:MAG TPA: hypothetical protein V6C97_09670 [Oculatellaceae cyanobacterium]
MSGVDDLAKRKSYWNIVIKSLSGLPTTDLERLSKKCARIPAHSTVKLRRRQAVSLNGKMQIEILIHALWSDAPASSFDFETGPEMLALRVWRAIVQARSGTTIGRAVASIRRTSWYQASNSKNCLEELCINGCGRTREGRALYCDRANDCSQAFHKWVKEQDVKSASLERNLNKKMLKFRGALAKNTRKDI